MLSSQKAGRETGHKQSEIDVNRLTTIWEGMEPRKKFVAGLAALAALIAIVGLARVASTPGMALLYSGLDPAASGGVISALESRGLSYEVRGDSIYVPEADRDRTRMALAAEGRPSAGPMGYELLDGISGFGTTSEMFDATYWRAKEGELARTILALPGVLRARVHIANPVRRPFEKRTDQTASVSVAMRVGALGETQALAIRHLVSSAVAGLSPNSVAVIDADGGVVLEAGEEKSFARAGSMAEARAASLRSNVERLLAARVGPGAAVVEVSVEADLNSEKITERVLDPEGRVAIHTDTEESSDDETGGAANVTVASNLPDQENGGGEGSKRNSSQTRERVNYEVSEVLRERIRNPGEIRRISVAVLVDGVRSGGADGVETWAPRPEEELEALQELVQTAIGFDASRGDVVSIESMEFTTPPELGVVAEADALDFFATNAMTLVQLGVLSAVALALGLMVLRPMILAKPSPLLTNAGELEGPEITAIDVSESIDAAGDVIDADGMSTDSLQKLRNAVAMRPEDATLLLRGWLEGPETEKGRA